MTEQDDVQTDAWGIDHRYQDAHGEWHDVPEETRAALLAAMRADPEEELDRVRIVYRGTRHQVEGVRAVLLESGEEVTVSAILPADLPLGYHALQFDDGHEERLIVAPRRCFLAAEPHISGWALQLYALRSRASWGIGDLADLRQFAEWSARELDAGVIMVNPLHAATPGLPQQSSPYFPSSRRFRNPLYLRIEEIPGATELGAELERMAADGRLLNENRIIDRDVVYRLKMDALDQLWRGFRGDDAFDDYCRREGKGLEQFAAFCVLSEQHGRGWRRWAREFRHPDAAGVSRTIEESNERLRFHMWLQWQLDAQLARASDPLAIMQDLPIGVDPDGADAWQWQGVIAQGVSVGAPPDLFNTKGQDWGLPPFIPHRLRAAAYEPFVQIIRASLRHAGGLRIDHVMGLFRLYWIPAGMGPQMGAYVRYRADELLAIVALESQRARAFVVGEDLGTVEEGVREKLSERGVLSYRLMWFEDVPPSEFPVDALAAVSTHDLPTIAGVWTGADLEAQKRIGMQPNEEGQERWKEKLARLVDDDAASTNQVIERAYEDLARAPSRIVVASLEDALAVEERPNMPATLNDQWPNWSLALPATAEEIRNNELVRKVARALAARRTTSVVHSQDAAKLSARS